MHPEIDVRMGGSQSEELPTRLPLDQNLPRPASVGKSMQTRNWSLDFHNVEA